MKKYSIVLLSLILIFNSCESSQNKESRLIIAKYSRKLSSIMKSIVDSRHEEGSQSRITLNSFYDRYFLTLEEFSNDLNFETISTKYESSRDQLLSISKQISEYLNFRKDAIINMTDAMTAYESVNKYVIDIEESMKALNEASSNSKKFYRRNLISTAEKAKDGSLEFLIKKKHYMENLALMELSITYVESSCTRFNAIADSIKLEERLIIPKNYMDSINDWLVAAKISIKELEAPRPKPVSEY